MLFSASGEGAEGGGHLVTDRLHAVEERDSVFSATRPLDLPPGCSLVETIDHADRFARSGAFDAVRVIAAGPMTWIDRAVSLPSIA